MPARCLRCATDLSRLHPLARYCPKCGLDTLSGPPAKIVHSGNCERPGLLNQWQHYVELTAPDSADVRQSPAPSGQTSSLILTGYSNALYNLGRRYESGAGAAKNTHEATRCYLKAARLGNFLALARLAAWWFAPADRNRARQKDPPA